MPAMQASISAAQLPGVAGGTFAAAAGAGILFDAGRFTLSVTFSGEPVGSVGSDAGATLSVPAGGARLELISDPLGEMYGEVLG